MDDVEEQQLRRVVICLLDVLAVVVAVLGCDVALDEGQAHFVLLLVLKCVVAVQLLVALLPVAQLVAGGSMMKYWVGDLGVSAFVDTAGFELTSVGFAGDVQVLL